MATDQEDVRGFDVAVDDADRVRRPERVCHPRHEIDRLGRRDSSLAEEARSERLSVEPLHHEVGHAALGGPGVRHVHDVRMIQPAERSPLVSQPADEIGTIPELPDQDLEDEALPELDVLDFENAAHPACPEQADHSITSPRQDVAVVKLPLSQRSLPRRRAPPRNLRHRGAEHTERQSLRRETSSGFHEGSIGLTRPPVSARIAEPARFRALPGSRLNGWPTLSSRRAARGCPSELITRTEPRARTARAAR